MEEKLLSISQLAKLRKLTSETLRHYDRIGLIKPTYVDPQSNYRYYSIRQYEKLGTIKELRQLGMSLETIVDYFSQRNVEKSQAILAAHCSKVQKEMAETKKRYRVLREKLDFIAGLADLPPANEVHRVMLPKRYMITYGEAAGGPQEHALILTRLEGELNEIAPILASDRVGVYGDQKLLENNEAYMPAVPFIFLKKPGRSPLVKVLPAGAYLTMHYYDGQLEHYHPALEYLNTYLQEHHCHVRASILQIYKLDVTLTSNHAETMIEIQVPID